MEIVSVQLIGHDLICGRVPTRAERRALKGALRSHVMQFEGYTERITLPTKGTLVTSVTLKRTTF